LVPAAAKNWFKSQYEDFPKGFTIGPIESLTTFSSQDKVKYFLEKLPQFRDVGWITEDAFRRYERQLKDNNLSAVLDGLDHDLTTEQIASEVFAMVQALK
jgi:hypothetical protein